MIQVGMLETIREMAVKRVREGESATAVMASYGFSRTTIYKWLPKVKGRGNGLKKLKSTKGTGRPRSLTPTQERQVFRWVNGKDPRQYGFDFGLWTRQIVRVCSRGNLACIWVSLRSGCCWRSWG